MSEQNDAKSSKKQYMSRKTSASIQQNAKKLVLHNVPPLRMKISLFILLALVLGLFLSFIRRLIGTSEDYDSKKEAGVVAKNHHLADNSRTQINSNIQVESMLIADFSYWGNLQNQIRNDMTNIFYIFLVMATIFAAGLVAAANLYFNLRQANTLLSQYTVEALIAVILIAAGILSRYFLKRTIHLSQEYMKCSKNLDDISKYYAVQLAPLISDAQLLVSTLITLLNKRHGTENPREVPSYIRTTIFMVGSFCYAIAAFIAFGRISFLLAHSFPFLYTSAYYWVFTFAVITSADFCGLCFLIFRRFYFSGNRSNRMLVLRGVLPLLLLFVGLCLVFSIAGFHLFPLLKNNDTKAYTMVIPLAPLVFFLSLVYYWLLYHKDIGDIS